MTVLGSLLSGRAGGAGGGGGGGGGVTIAPTNPLSTWATFDSSGGSILSGVAAQHASATDRVVVTLQNPATASQGPGAGCGVYGPLSELTGMTSGAFKINGESMIAIFAACLRRPVAAFADVEWFCYLYDDGGDLGSAGGAAAPSSTSPGWGCGMVYTSGEWQPLSYGGSGAAIARDEATFNRTSPDNDGVLGQYMGSRLTQRLYHAANGVMADGATRTVDDTGTTPAPDNANQFQRHFNSVALGCGWSTGTGGSGPVDVPLFAAVEALTRGYRG